VKYAESALHARFSGDGLVRGPTNRGWLRKRLQELLEAFPDPESAQRWVRAACFKAKGGVTPMAYFAALISKAAGDAELRDVRRLLSAEEHAAFERAEDRHGNPGQPGQRGTA
jgi:hypothetical protein